MMILDTLWVFVPKKRKGCFVVHDSETNLDDIPTKP
jgi:hypothetical protein